MVKLFSFIQTVPSYFYDWSDGISLGITTHACIYLL